MEPTGETAPTGGARRRVSYYYDPDIGTYAYTMVHPMKPHRIKMAHNLIVNYGLDKKMEVLRPKRSTPFDMTSFHTDEYIDFLQRVSPESVDELTGKGTRFLIGEDCPAFDGLFEFCSISAGGSTSAAKRINSGHTDIAVNWAGGLHHAKKREASGFCYVNDIVLGILELLRCHARVLYIDIDIHHGDGVEEAFYSTDRVMTCSFHKFGDYFPGTGDLHDVGIGKGKNYAVNVPLKDGIDDETYKSIFRPIIQKIMDWYRPGAVILQCGADSLAEDKLGCFNLSMRGHAECVRFVRTFDVPVIVLGGGGYTIRNVARTWTYETGVLLGEELPPYLPFNEYFEYYGPEFKLDVPNNNMDNQNSKKYLDGILETVTRQLGSMPFAPSVQHHQVPHDISDDDMGESDEELETRITQRQRDLFVARYGDTLSDSEDEEPIMLKRPPPPPLMPLPGGTAAWAGAAPGIGAGTAGGGQPQPNGNGKRPRRTLPEERLSQQQLVAQMRARQEEEAAAAAAHHHHGGHLNGRGGKPVRSFFPP